MDDFDDMMEADVEDVEPLYDAVAAELQEAEVVLDESSRPLKRTRAVGGAGADVDGGY